MTLSLVLAVTVAVFAQSTKPPVCTREPDRDAVSLRGNLKRGEPFEQATRGGWIFRLVPNPEGWRLEVSTQGREAENLTRFTPPWHFVPNALDIAGWHFRNTDNTGPNTGSVNAPQRLREFIFSPEVGRSIHYNGSATSSADVERVRAFGRGWLWLESFTLTPVRRGARAAFETIAFSACLTWPTSGAPGNGDGQR